MLQRKTGIKSPRHGALHLNASLENATAEEHGERHHRDATGKIQKVRNCIGKTTLFLPQNKMARKQTDGDFYRIKEVK